MSFLVAFNGQFSPHQRIERVSNRVPSVVGIRHSSRVTEFQDILQQEDSESAPKPHPKIEAYELHTKSFQHQKKREHARDIMNSPVKVISQDALITEAVKMLKNYGFRHLPVVNGSNIIVGMISDRELINSDGKLRCHEIMVQKLIVSDELTSINEIAITFLNEKINALPIIDRNQELTGIITQTDILNFVIRSTSFLGSA